MVDENRTDILQKVQIAVVQNDYRNRGGADRVATELARTFDAPVVTDSERVDTIPSDIRTIQIETGLLTRFLDFFPIPVPFTGLMRWQYVPELHNFDIIISSNSAGTMYIPMDDQATIHYTHSTPRIQSDRYQPDGAAFYKQGFVYALDSLMPHRRWPDVWLCNSEVTQRRLKRHWHVPADELEVVYPPVPVDKFSSDYADREKLPVDEPYFISVGRLSNNKRVDEVIRAFHSLPFQLVIAGDGEERTRIEEMSMGQNNIDVLGRVSEREKKKLLAGAEAFIMNAEWENFGLVTVEAFASGTPVIGVRSGFTEALVRHRDNGYVYDPGVENLSAAVEMFVDQSVSYSSSEIEKYAERFGVSVFREEMKRMVRRAWKETAPDVSDPHNVT